MLVAYFNPRSNQSDSPFHKMKEDVVIEIITCDIEEQVMIEFTKDEKAVVEAFVRKIYTLPNFVYTTSLHMPNEYFKDAIVFVKEFYIERLECILEVCAKHKNEFIISSHIGLYGFSLYVLEPETLKPFDSVFREYTINTILNDLE